MRALALVAMLWAGAAGAACRQALVLALDISGSVDASEYRLQIAGLAAALDAPDVRAAILAMPGAPDDLLVFEWSGQTTQRILLPWTELADAAALDRAIAVIAGARRAPSDPPTGMGAAMEFAAARLTERSGCWRRVIDVTGDGKSNTGPRPQDVRDKPAFDGVVVNGLVVASSNLPADTRDGGVADLSAYFRAWVIRGPDAFVETALGYEDFGNAMRRKLLRELQVLAVSDVENAQ